jgi:hypothetical protein
MGRVEIDFGLQPRRIIIGISIMFFLTLGEFAERETEREVVTYE